MSILKPVLLCTSVTLRKLQSAHWSPKIDDDICLTALCKPHLPKPPFGRSSSPLVLLPNPIPSDLMSRTYLVCVKRNAARDVVLGDLCGCRCYQGA